MVNRRGIVLFLGISMINKLRLVVLCVARITECVCACVCGVLVCISVCMFSGGIRVVLAYNCYTLFFTPSYLLQGNVTSPFLASVTQ